MNPLLSTIQQLHKRHIDFLSNFTSEMVNYFAKMKDLYHEEEVKRKRIFQQQKEEISRMVLEKKLQREKKDDKLRKKEAKKEKSERKKREKQIKLKLNAPKAPNSPYFMFFMDYKEKIKQDFPEYSMIQAAKMAGKLWKELEEHEKSIYYEKHQEERRVYQQDMKEYKQKRKAWEADEEEKAKWQKMLKGDKDGNEQKINGQVNGNKGEKCEQKKQNYSILEQNKDPDQQVQLSVSCSQDSHSQEWGQPEIKPLNQLPSECKTQKNLPASDNQGQFKLPDITTEILQKLKDESKILMEQTRKQIIQKKDLHMINGKTEQQLNQEAISINQAQAEKSTGISFLKGVELIDSIEFNDDSLGESQNSI